MSTSATLDRVKTDAEQRTEAALHTILQKLGGDEFAQTYLADFVRYVRTGELTDRLASLRDHRDEAFLKAFDIVCRAQAKAISDLEPVKPHSGALSFVNRLLPWRALSVRHLGKSAKEKDLAETIR